MSRVEDSLSSFLFLEAKKGYLIWTVHHSLLHTGKGVTWHIVLMQNPVVCIFFFFAFHPVSELDKAVGKEGRDVIQTFHCSVLLSL